MSGSTPPIPPTMLLGVHAVNFTYTCNSER